MDKQSYDDCHIKGSISVELNDLATFADGLDKDKAEVVVYCSNYMCSASEFVCKKLEAMGFKHVWAYEGGMAEWYQLGLPVEGPAKSSYLTKKIEKPAIEHQDIKVITASELEQKMRNEQ